MWNTTKTIEAHRALLAERVKPVARTHSSKDTRKGTTPVRLGRTALAR